MFSYPRRFWARPLMAARRRVRATRPELLTLVPPSDGVAVKGLCMPACSRAGIRTCWSISVRKGHRRSWCDWQAARRLRAGRQGRGRASHSRHRSPRISARKLRPSDCTQTRAHDKEKAHDTREEDRRNDEARDGFVRVSVAPGKPGRRCDLRQCRNTDFSPLIGLCGARTEGGGGAAPPDCKRTRTLR